MPVAETEVLRMPDFPEVQSEEDLADLVDTQDTAPYWEGMAPVDAGSFRVCRRGETATKERRGSMTDTCTATGSAIARTRRGVLEWLEAIRYRDEGWGRWPYSAGMLRPYGLQSSAFAVRILDDLGVLAAVPAEQRAEAVRFFQSTQDPADGHLRIPWSPRPTTPAIIRGSRSTASGRRPARRCRSWAPPHSIRYPRRASWT